VTGDHQRNDRIGGSGVGVRPVKSIPFTATDVKDPKRTRQFASLADMAEEQKNVRVWGGVHYRFAIRASEDVGPKVVAYMIENTLKPVR
jgi:hypothetical protein